MLFFREREDINLSSYRWFVGLQFASGIECPFSVKYGGSEKVCVVGVATLLLAQCPNTRLTQYNKPRATGAGKNKSWRNGGRTWSETKSAKERNVQT